MKIALPDLISNSYFPAAAASALGFFKAEGLDLVHELVFPVDRAYRDLRDGKVDFVAGSAHSALAAFPEWQGVKLICAQAQGMYWFLVMHRRFNAQRGALDVVKGKRIGAAPWVDMGLQRLLIEAGYDLARDDIKIAPVPGAAAGSSPTVNFGLTAAKALEEGAIDGFWANGMGAEVAVTRGIGTVVLDVRRGDGPAECFNYTMASLAVTDCFLAGRPDDARKIVTAMEATHAALKSDVSLAEQVANAYFPPSEAALITPLIARDLAYYTAAITPEFVAGMNAFARARGILKGDPRHEDVVAQI